MANAIGRGRNRVRNEDLLTTVDQFIAGFKPVEERDQYLQNKADERKAALDEEEKRRKAAERNRRSGGSGGDRLP